MAETNSENNHPVNITPQISDKAGSKGNSSKSQKNMANAAHLSPRSSQHGSTTPISPSSPIFYPYSYIDPEHYQAALNAGYDPTDPTSAYAGAYMYGMTPTFPAAYYPDSYPGSAMSSFPGSPNLNPAHSPPYSPASPFFNPSSPAAYYQAQGIPPPNGYHSPPTMPYMYSAGQPIPPFHIGSPLLNGTLSAPSSPPHNHLQRLPPAAIHPNSPPQRSGYANNQGNRRHSVPHGNYPTVQQQQQQQQQQQGQSQNQSQPATHNLNIYIRGLMPSMTDEALHDMCKMYGTIHSSKAIIDQKTGDCKGYGFVMYENEEEAQDAIDALNSMGLQVSFAKVGQESFSARLKNLQDEQSTNIYISNLPITMSEPELENMFLPFKTVSTRILRDPNTGISRGVGFSRMVDRQSAISIINKFNQHTLPGSNVPLQVRFADSLAQKRLKGQTARKRMWKAREYQTFSGLPVTPETILGIAPVVAGGSPPGLGSFFGDTRIPAYPAPTTNYLPGQFPVGYDVQMQARPNYYPPQQRIPQPMNQHYSDDGSASAAAGTSGRTTPATLELESDTRTPDGDNRINEQMAELDSKVKKLSVGVAEN